MHVRQMSKQAYVNWDSHIIPSRISQFILRRSTRQIAGEREPISSWRSLEIENPESYQFAYRALHVPSTGYS